MIAVSLAAIPIVMLVGSLLFGPIFAGMVLLLVLSGGVFCAALQFMEDFDLFQGDK